MGTNFDKFFERVATLKDENGAHSIFSETPEPNSGNPDVEPQQSASSVSDYRQNEKYTETTEVTTRPETQTVPESLSQNVSPTTWTLPARNSWNGRGSTAYTARHTENTYYSHVQRSPTLADTKQRLVQEWKRIKNTGASLSNKYLKLAGEEHFSREFYELLGKANVTDIHGLEDEHLAIAIFEAMVEEAAHRQLSLGSNRTLDDLLEFWDGDVQVSNLSGQRGRIQWHIRPGNAEGTSFVELVRHLFTISPLDAIATLAVIVGLSFDNIRRLSSDSHLAESTGFTEVSDLIPRFLQLSGQRGHVECKTLRIIKGPSDQAIGAIVVYEHGSAVFALPATVGRKELSIAAYKATAFWLEQHKMDNLPGAIILLCQDVRVAIRFNEILEKLRNTNGLPIITGHLFADLSVLPWNYFFGHDVFFVPASTKTCMAMVKVYRDYILGGGAKSFKIATHILLHAKPNYDLEDIPYQDLSDVEVELLAKAIYLDGVDYPAREVKRVLDEAIFYDEYIHWGKDAGIFKTSQELDDKTQQYAEGGGLKIFDPSHVPATNQPQNLQDVTLSQIAPAGGVVMAHGFKNAGKSTAIFELMHAKVTGDPAFGLFFVEDPGNGLLLDSETLAEDFRLRIERHGLSSALGRSFFPIAKQDPAYAEKEDMVLNNKEFQRQLEKQITEQKAAYLGLDNLTSLTKPGTLYNQKHVGDIFAWVDSVAAKGVTTLMVHHSHKPENTHAGNTRMRGSAEFSIRAHTELVVIGQDDINANPALATDEVRTAATGAGRTLGIHFKVCKMASIIEGHTFWFHIPQNDRTVWKLLAITGRDNKAISPMPFPSTPIADCAKRYTEEAVDTDGASLNQSSSDMAAPSCCTGSTLELTEDEKKIVDVVKNDGSIQTGGVCKHLRIKDTKARDLLKGLAGKGVLEQFGDGRAAAYRLKG